jgi:hypothetical protein
LGGTIPADLFNRSQDAQFFRFQIELTGAEMVLSSVIRVKKLHFFLKIAMKIVRQAAIVDG